MAEKKIFNNNFRQKSNLEYLEKDVGLEKFLPKNVIANQVTQFWHKSAFKVCIR